MRAWTEIIAELTDCFSDKEARLNLLGRIDRGILDPEKSLDDLFAEVLRDFIEYSKLSNGAFYIFSGEEPILLCGSNGAYPRINSLSTSPSILEGLKSSERLFETPDQTLQSDAAVTYEITNARLLVRISPEKKLWGFLSLEMLTPDDKKILEDKSLRNFASNVCDQLAIAVGNRAQHDELLQLRNVQKAFLESDLDISKILTSLTNNVVSALPSLRCLRIGSLPEVQLLFHLEGEPYLTIKATSGAEMPNTRLQINESISGIIIQEPHRAYYLCDPREQSGRYKSYLGKTPSGVKSKEIRTELVIPIRFYDRIIGVLNLESEIEHAFRTAHVDALLQFSERISPIINALQKRLDRIETQSKANTYAMSKFLKRLAEMYQHKMSTPFFLAIGTLDQLQREATQTTSSPETDGTDTSFGRKVAEWLESGVEQIKNVRDYHFQFGDDLPKYVLFGDHQINKIIEEAIRSIDQSDLRKCEIDIIFQPEADYTVFCSAFLREHFIDILRNSVYSLCKRKEGQPRRKGEIRIRTSLEVDPQVELNKHCKVVIRDNGMGMSEFDLRKIVEGMRFTTKERGTGLGLYAAREYLKSVGGDLEVSSKESVFFEVGMLLQIFNQDIHGGKNVLAPSGEEWRNEK